MSMVTLILAGGEGTRLGRADKALLALDGRPILSQILAKLAGPIALSANGDPARYDRFDLPVLADTVIGRGPLAGVLAGLEWAADLGADTLLTVPGDTPFVPADLAARLGPAPAWVENSSGLHHLVAVWPVGCRADLHQWLAVGKSGRVHAFGASIGMRAVWFADTPDPFFNINTPADLAVAKARRA